MVQKFKKWGTKLEVKRDVFDILVEDGVDPTEIESIIWSHLHWDHTGNPARFPPSAKLLVGPGIKEKYMPGWPSNPDAEFREEDIAGREIVGLTNHSFDQEIGGMPALDYFGDGSFYILDAPGHSRGHLNALARTSVELESFIFMAADSVHLGGELRPSKAMPLPAMLDISGLMPRPCPCEALLELHPKRSAVTPYLGLDPGFPENLSDAESTIQLIQAFDADDRVLVIFAHDTSIFHMLDFFPKTANDWKRMGWKDRGFWMFLTLAADSKPRRQLDKSNRKFLNTFGHSPPLALDSALQAMPHWSLPHRWDIFRQDTSYRS